MDFLPLLEERVTSISIRDDDEWIVIGFKHRNPWKPLREIAHTLIDEVLVYMSPSTVYRILKKHGLITLWNRKIWESTRLERANRPDERWQTGIMYIEISWSFLCLLIFKDEYNRYMVHHSLLTSRNTDSVSMETQTAIDNLREYSLAEPVIQGDNGSSYIAMEFKLMLRENHLAQKLIRTHTYWERHSGEGQHDNEGVTGTVDTDRL